MACLAAFIRLVRVDSETIRPLQTPAINSSLLMTRSRSRIRKCKRSKTSGSTAIRLPLQLNSRRSESSKKSSKEYSTRGHPLQDPKTRKPGDVPKSIVRTDLSSSPYKKPAIQMQENDPCWGKLIPQQSSQRFLSVSH